MKLSAERLSADRPAVQLTFVAAVTFAAYVRALSRYFVSEDFLILRVLSQGAVWENARAQLAGPWLGYTFTYLPFYRPVSSIVLDLELRVWGPWPTGFHLSHFLVHVVNVVLVYRIAQRLAGRGGSVPFASALLFALYPLHPNTVVFIGSFSTLFAATACLASYLLFLRSRQDGGWGTMGGSWLCFALALGCYEAAVVLPGLLLAGDLLFGGVGREGSGWRSLAVRHLPFLALVAGYLGVRRWVLGLWIGRDFAGLLSTLGFDWARFVLPSYFSPEPVWTRWTAGALVATGVSWGLYRLLRSRLREGEEGPVEARLWLFAPFWIWLAQLPFGVPGVVPATGRFWYLSSAGLGLLVAAAVGAPVPRPWRRRAVAAVALVLGLGHFALLSRYVGLYAEAGRTTREIQARVDSFVGSASPDRPVFVAGYPTFLRDGRPSVRVATVFHWGLTDAMRPPFLERDLRVYPLPPFSRSRLVPLLLRPDAGPALRWLGYWLGPMSRDVPRPPRRIEILRPSDGELRDDFLVRFAAPDAARCWFVLLGRGQAGTGLIGDGTCSGDVVEGQLPPRFVDSMLRLYHDDVFWWIEGQDAEGNPVAFSEMRRIAYRPAGP